MKNNYVLFLGLGVSIACQSMTDVRVQEYIARHTIAADAWEKSVMHAKQLGLTEDQACAIQNDNTTDVHIAALQSNYHMLDKMLLTAATVGSYTVAKMALKYGAKIDPENVHIKGKSRIAMIDPISGDNPLLAAVRNGHAEIVQLLLDHGAYSNAPRGRCGSGETPLQIAVKNGCTKIVRMLVTADASVDTLMDGFSLSSLEIARQELEEAKKHKNARMILRYKRIIKILLQPVVKIIDGSTLVIAE